MLCSWTYSLAWGPQQTWTMAGDSQLKWRCSCGDVKICLLIYFSSIFMWLKNELDYQVILNPWILSVTRSLKSLISSLHIDTGFLGFFSGLIMTLTNMNINCFCATTESDKPRILKGGFCPIKTHDVGKCFSRSNLILCIRLSKNLQAYTSKWCNFKDKKSSREVKNFTYKSMNFDSLSAEHDRCDFGLGLFELQQEREQSRESPAQ